MFSRSIFKGCLHGIVNSCHWIDSNESLLYSLSLSLLPVFKQKIMRIIKTDLITIHSYAYIIMYELARKVKTGRNNYFKISGPDKNWSKWL